MYMLNKIGIGLKQVSSILQFKGFLIIEYGEHSLMIRLYF